MKFNVLNWFQFFKNVDLDKRLKLDEELQTLVGYDKCQSKMSLQHFTVQLVIENVQGMCARKVTKVFFHRTILYLSMVWG